MTRPETSALARIHAGCGTDLTLKAFRKRFRAEQEKDPSLTPESFGAQPAKWARLRPAVTATILTIGGEEISVTEVIKRLGNSNGGGTAFVNALWQFVRENPDRREFDSLKQLQGELRRGVSGHGGNIANNPIVVDGVRYSNAARLYEDFANEIRIAQRTLTDRILTLRKEREMVDKTPLDLTKEELVALCRGHDRLSRGDFCARVVAYCDVHVVMLVNKNDEPTTPELEYDSSYVNNATLFYFRCPKTKAEEEAKASAEGETNFKYPPYSKSVAKFDQGCPACARAEGARSRRAPESEIVKLIEMHQLGMEYVRGGAEEEYKNQYSPITARIIKCGHLLTRSYASFRDEHLVVCPTCNPNVGETLTLAVAGYLLGASPEEIAAAREFTPPWLRKKAKGGIGYLRYDGFFRNHPLPSGRILILEHHGYQHYGDDGGIYQRTEEDKAKAAKNDKIKEKEARERSEEVALAIVPDVVLYCKNLLEAGTYIVGHLLNQVPELRKVPSFNKKVRKLNDAEFLLKLASEMGLAARPETRLREQLDMEGKTHITIKSYDPVAACFALTCDHECHEPYTWSPLACNVLRGRNEERQVNGCPRCGIIARASKRRLLESEIDARGARHGLVRMFDYEAYKNNRTILPWKCEKSGHSVQVSLEKMSDCRQCAS